MFPKIKIYNLPWKVFKITKLNSGFIIDAGNYSIWITWGNKK